MVAAQEKMIAKDGKEYTATSNWKFSCKDYAYTGNLEVQIAKTDKGGLLKLGITRQALMGQFSNAS